jgi:hypothetical protein
MYSIKVTCDAILMPADYESDSAQPCGWSEHVRRHRPITASLNLDLSQR